MGVPGGGTRGTPSLVSALVLLFSNRVLSSVLMLVLAVSASSILNTSSKARRFGDSRVPSGFFFGGSRSRIRGCILGFEGIGAASGSDLGGGTLDLGRLFDS